MDSNRCRNKKLFILIVILFVLSLNAVLLNQNFNQNTYINDNKHSKDNDTFSEINIKNQDLSEESVYSSTSAKSWNVTQKIEGTFTDIETTFSDNSDGLAEIPFEDDWVGYKAEVNVKDLYDERNWNNGTFHFGDDDNDDSPNQDDSTDPRISNNKFQNWSFYSQDNNPYLNWMSGNYFDSNYVYSGGHDCLELRMNATRQQFPWMQSPYNTYWWSSYDEGDACWWNTTIQVDRGRLIDSVLKLEVNPYHVRESDNWVLKISLNGQKIYTYGMLALIDKIGHSTWGNLSIPQYSWLNKTPVFSDEPLKNNLVNLEIKLESLGGNMSGFTNERYQQLFIDNVEFVPKAEIFPSNISLKMNNTIVD
ncbi:MAG: hypothetical protein ACFFAO_05455, partial [Candidatus Hermodarchaeota archaeon]